MINIIAYRKYIESVRERIPVIKKVLPVTIDEEMGKDIQSLSNEDCPVLLVIVPTATGNSPSVDNIQEDNLCVIFLMDKYDPQRKKSYEVLEETQPIIEQIKCVLIDDKASGCKVVEKLDLNSLSTLPETGFYRNFAGWSLAFSFKTK